MPQWELKKMLDLGAHLRSVELEGNANPRDAGVLRQEGPLKIN